MTRRGLTLFELLLSLALLSVVCGAALSWTQIAAHAGVASAMRDTWLSAADAVLQRIHDDIACGDFGAGHAQESRRQPPRVRTADGILEIDTRWPGLGPVTHEYHLDPAGRGLWRRQVGLSTDPTERLLLIDVATWSCQIDEETGTLAVHITSGREIAVERRYDLR